MTAALLAAAGCTETPVAASGPPEAAESPAPEPPSPAPAVSPVTIMGAGDIARHPEAATATAELIRAGNPDAVFTTGDNAYPDGSPSDYAEIYEPTWGSFREQTHPVPGNHDYLTAGAAGYVGYFGAENVTNDVDGGLYYAWDVGNGWRAYALNSEISATGAQLSWLRDDLSAHAGQRYILYVHRPRYTSSAEHGPSDDICPLWDVVAATGGLEIVLAGHNHHYERFAPMDCDGRASADGARSFVVGSGGASLYDFGEAQRGSEFRNDTDFGVLRLELQETSYEWEFIASGRGHDGDDVVDTGNAGQILDKGSAAV
jgi:3',5'-cyclic AMP phosphodiesterase CpdA